MVNPCILHQMLSCAPVISIIIWRWSIHYTSLSAMLKLLHSKQIKNCMKSTSVTKAATIKNTNETVPPSYRCCCHQWSSKKWSIHYTSLSTILHSLHTNMNHDLVKKHCNQSSHNEKYRWFTLHMQRKPSCATTKLTYFDVSKDEWNTKEDTG